MTRKKPRKKRGRRSIATENKAGTLNTRRAATDRPVGAPINLSNQDIQELKEFASLSKSTPARPRRNRNHGNRIAVDSGATVSLIKKKEWLGSLQNRIKAHVTTANGSTSQTSGHGPLRVWVEQDNGCAIELKTIGEGFIMKDLTMNLLSVSQMCENGCTVVFKPHDAYLLTPDKQRVNLEHDGGLYFIPLTNDRDNNHNESPPSSTGKPSTKSARAQNRKAQAHKEAGMIMAYAAAHGFHP